MENCDGERQIAVLLHIEVDELRRAERHRQSIEAADLFGDCRNCFVEGKRAYLRMNGRDFHRNVVHVLTAQCGLDEVHSLGRFVLTENGLSKNVDVRSVPGARAAGQMTFEAGVAIKHDGALGLPAQASKHDRHHHLGGESGGGCADG